MTLDLNKEEMVNLIFGYNPSWKGMEHFLIKDNGRFCGGFLDRWEWDRNILKRRTEEELESIIICLRDKENHF